MKIQQQYTGNKPSFKAKLNLNSSGMREYKEYLERCIDAPAGYFSSNKNIELLKKICKAFEKHPSQETIDTDVYYRYGELFNARGVLKTSCGRITDIEPARSDDGTAPMQNLFRKFLNPDNRNIFNELLGAEYSKDYTKWWNTNIKPIWKEIKETFKMEEILEGVTEKDYNKEFRKQIQRYSSKTRNN